MPQEQPAPARGPNQPPAPPPTPRPDPDTQRTRRLGLIAGMLGCSVMAGRGLLATFDPRSEGRLLNTAPVLGFDLFLLIGILGVLYCGFRLLRGR